jgi:hypothetical protein
MIFLDFFTAGEAVALVFGMNFSFRLLKPFYAPIERNVGTE